MGLIEIELGELVQLVDERNTDTKFLDFYGININKEFMPTVAKTDEIDPCKYKVLRKNRFVFSGMQTGRDKCIRIGLFIKDNPVIVSPAYTTFEIKRLDLIEPEYFFMLFLSKEMDRYGWFLSDSSVRSNLDWPRFCEIPLKLPSPEVQLKTVDVYKALQANLAAYTVGLDDLKLTYDLYLDNIKKQYSRTPIRDLLHAIDIRNKDLRVKNVSGVNIEKRFMPSVANLKSTDISKYKIVPPQGFAANFMHIGRDIKLPIAYHSGDEDIVVSPAYSVFQVKNAEVIPEYIMIWFMRIETDRFGWFLSDSSVRGGLEVNRFFDIEIPIPPKEIQQSIVDIYHAQYERQKIAEELNQILKVSCPVLIRQSLSDQPIT